MPRLLDSKALHSGIPTECVSANTVVCEAQLEYPGIAGTGFFGRREQQMFYFTAVHCVRAGPASPKPTFATPLIPYRHTGSTDAPEDFVQFESAYTLEIFLGSDWQDTVDLIAYPVIPPTRARDHRHLLGRSAKLPSCARWLETYLETLPGSRALAEKSLAAVMIGFPQQSPNNSIEYADSPSPSVVRTEALVLAAIVGPSSIPGCVAIEPKDCPYGFAGFSGSPVFARIAGTSGPQYALIGMVVCGSKSVLHILRVEKLLEAAIGDA